MFDVTSGDVSLATHFDIFAAAGGARKVSYITGPVDHEDDSIKGPLTVSFAASKGTGKFNTFEVKNASGASVVAFNASDLAEPFSAAAFAFRKSTSRQSGSDPSQPLQARENDLIRRMSLAEKVGAIAERGAGNPADWPSGL